MAMKSEEGGVSMTSKMNAWAAAGGVRTGRQGGQVTPHTLAVMRAFAMASCVVVDMQQGVVNGMNTRQGQQTRVGHEESESERGGGREKRGTKKRDMQRKVDRKKS